MLALIAVSKNPIRVCLYILDAGSPSSSARRSIKYCMKSPYPISKYLRIALQWPINLNFWNNIFIKEEFVTSYAWLTQLFNFENVSDVEPYNLSASNGNYKEISKTQSISPQHLLIKLTAFPVYNIFLASSLLKNEGIII